MIRKDTAPVRRWRDLDVRAAAVHSHDARCCGGRAVVVYGGGGEQLVAVGQIQRGAEAVARHRGGDAVDRHRGD
ncbi:MAG: hypothetical protein R2856_07375 [Caldilineaceae bacterium]